MTDELTTSERPTERFRETAPRSSPGAVDGLTTPQGWGLALGNSNSMVLMLPA